MATKIYDSSFVELVDGTQIYITPLKIKYLREFMDAFENVKISRNDDQAMSVLSSCAAIAMKQYYPSIATVEDLEDNMDMPNIYKLLDASAGIKIKQDQEEQESVKEQAVESGSSWDKLDLAKLETELFTLGIWKDYEDLEMSLSMPELIATLETKRELDYEEKKFLAAIQGVDIEKGKNEKNAWEEMKARVFSGGKTSDPNDIASFQGQKAAKAGFGVGMGIDFEDLTKK